MGDNLGGWVAIARPNRPYSYDQPSTTPRCMQGQLSEIDIRSILQLIELGQRTGELFVETYVSSGGSGGSTGRADAGRRRFWFVFFLNGQIVYATNPNSGTARLRDFLRRYHLEAELDRLSVPAIASISEPEYGYLWALLEHHVLDPSQGRTILQGMVRETLFDLLSLHQGAFTFETGPALTPQLTTLPINALISRVMKQVQEWKQFYPHIPSPDLGPVVTDAEKLKGILPPGTFDTIHQWSEEQASIRQIARYLNRDILQVARAVYPYIQQGLVQMVDRSAPSTKTLTPNLEATAASEENPRRPRIACLEDSSTVRKAIEQTLRQLGYEVVALENPLKALGLLFQIRPDLILCDIAMPELDGYEICAMLRQSTIFRQTPIVMLTGKDGFIDRMQARVVGATDYLTKPFKKQELRMLVEKYVGPGYVTPPTHPDLDESP